MPDEQPDADSPNALALPPPTEQLLPSEELWKRLLENRGSLFPTFPEDDAISLLADLARLKERTSALAFRQREEWTLNLSTILDAAWFVAAFSFSPDTQFSPHIDQARKALTKIAAETFATATGRPIPRRRSHLDELNALVKRLAETNGSFLQWCRDNAKEPTTNIVAQWMIEHFLEAFIKGRLLYTLARIPLETFLDPERNIQVGLGLMPATEDTLQKATTPWEGELCCLAVVRTWLRVLGLSASEADDLMPRRG